MLNNVWQVKQLNDNNDTLLLFQPNIKELISSSSLQKIRVRLEMQLELQEAIDLFFLYA